MPLANNVSALSYGAELTATWKLREHWELFGSYSVFQINATGSEPDPFFIHAVQRHHGEQPVLSRARSWDSADNWQFDLIGRYVDRLAFVDVPQYIEMDLRLAWRQATTWKSAWSARTC